MSAQISAYGRLVADIQSRTTEKGTPMSMGRLAVSLPCHSAPEGQATLWLGVVAFGRQADVLARHHKGDLISVAGLLQLNQWTGKDGTQQSGYQVIADSVVSASSLFPTGGHKKTASDEAEPSATTAVQPADADAPPGIYASDWEIYAREGERSELDQRPPFED